MCEELDVLIRQADKKKALLGIKEPLAPEVVEAYQERFLNEGIYNSLAIEGNSLTQEEIERIRTKDEVVAGKPFSDHLSVIGYCNAILLAKHYVRTKTRISEHEICKIHRRMLLSLWEGSGEYRTYNLMVRDRRPTTYEKIGDKMQQLIESYISLEDEHPIDVAAFVHLRLTKIHPFSDGNGRVGRVVTNLLLESAGYPAVVFPYEQKECYYAALEAYDGLRGNPNMVPMKLFLAELVNHQLDILLAL